MAQYAAIFEILIKGRNSTFSRSLPWRCRPDCLRFCVGPKSMVSLTKKTILRGFGLCHIKIYLVSPTRLCKILMILPPPFIFSQFAVDHLLDSAGDNATTTSPPPSLPQVIDNDRSVKKECSEGFSEKIIVLVSSESM